MGRDGPRWAGPFVCPDDLEPRGRPPAARATRRSGHANTDGEDHAAAPADADAVAAVDRKVSRLSRLSSGYEVVTEPLAFSLASLIRWLLSLPLF